MGRIVLGGKYTALILCLVMLGILLSAIYFVRQKNQSGDPNTLYGKFDDFNFRLNFNTLGKEQIDTYRGTLTKDLVMDGTKTVKFKIPNDVKKEIYKLMIDINILSFPDTLKVDGMAVTPSCDYKLTATINGRVKTIVWKEGFYPSMIDNLPKDNVNFLKLVKYISDYIYGTEEYKNMPQAKGGYE